jgi:hypothetical protein
MIGPKDTVVHISDAELEDIPTLIIVDLRTFIDE